MFLNKKLLLLVFTGLLCITSCEEEDYQAADFRCWINGKRYVKSGNCSWVTGNNCEFSVNLRDSILVMQAILIATDGTRGHLIRVELSSFSGTGTYRPGNGNFHALINEKLIDPAYEAEFTIVNYILHEAEGTMQISGYFFMANSENQITNGRFSQRFIIQ